MFIAMVSTTTTTTKQVVYNTSEFPGFFCYILRARISFGCIENFNLEKKSTKKNTSLELRQVTGPHHGVSSYSTRGPGAGAQAVLSDTLLPRGSKRRYKSFEYSTTTTTTTQLTPTTTRNFIPSAVLWPSRSRPAFESRFRTYIHYHAAAAMLIARFHISLYQSQDRILLWSRATHHSGSCIILCYILPQGRQHIFGPALLTWLGQFTLFIITTCQTNNSGGLRIESIWFLNRELDDEFTKWAEKIKTKLRILPSCLLLRRKETSVYILLLLLCWPLSIRRRAASRRTTLVPRAGLLTGSYLAENIADDRLLLNVDRKFTQMCRMCEEILRYLYINTRLLLLFPPFTDYR